MGSFGTLPWYVEYPYKVIRWLYRTGRFKKTFHRIKNWQLLAVLHDMHIHAVHKWRDFFLEEHDWEHLENTAKYAKELCCGCRDVMAQILGIQPRRMHCALKIVIEENGEQKVATFGRSEPCNRPAEFGLKNAHLASANSTFASLLGIYDGERSWRQPYSYFTCNDLPKHADIFKCDREDWPKWYKSTLVAPLRFWVSENGLHRVLGFLTFDLHTTDEFFGLPDIYQESFDDYHVKAAESALIHAAGIMADTLVMLLRPCLEERKKQNE